MINLKKYFVFSGLFFLLILLVNSFAKEVDRITITDAKQLKGIWETLYIYQETSRQERINTYLPPLPEREEFESEEEHQARIDDIKEVYERRVEENLKKEIKNEQKFKNMVFTFKLTYTPYLATQDSMRKYLSTTTEGYFQDSFKTGIEYSDGEYKAQDREIGHTNIKKTETIDVNPEECYEHREQMQVLRKKIGTAGLDTGAAAYNASLSNAGYPWHSMFAHFKIPSGPFALPSFAAWRTEESNFSLQEDIAYFTFSLDRYDMKEERFPVIFPLSQSTTEEKEWVYYTKTLIDWGCYTKTFKKPNAEKTEKWLIKFDEIPTYIPLPFEKAKMLRKNEERLTWELEFQPIRAEKKVLPDTTFYTLEVKLISAILKNVDEIIYVLAESVQ